MSQTTQAKNDGILIHLNAQEIHEISSRIDAAIRAGGSQAAYALIPIEQKIRAAVEQAQKPAQEEKTE